MNTNGYSPAGVTRMAHVEIRRLAWAGLLLLLSAAGALAVNVEGYVSRNSRPLAGVTVTYSRDNLSTVTDTNGYYRFLNVTPIGNLTASLPGVEFVRNGLEVGFAPQEQRHDFFVRLLAGRISQYTNQNQNDFSGPPVPNVRVRLRYSNQQLSGLEALTDADGRYEISGFSSSSIYYIEPVKNGLFFRPDGFPNPYFAVNGTDPNQFTNINFMISPNFDQWIAGFVNRGPVGEPGVTVIARQSGGGASYTNVTDEFGFYALRVQAGLNYEVTASKPGVTFSPATASASPNIGIIAGPTFYLAGNIGGQVLNPPDFVSANKQARLLSPFGGTAVTPFRADGSFLFTNVQVLPDGLRYRVELQEQSVGSRTSTPIYPRTILAAVGETNLVAQHYATSKAEARRFDNGSFPNLSGGMAVTREPVTSVFQVSPQLGDFPGLSVWQADYQPLLTNVSSLDFASKAAFGAVYGPAASLPFGLETTNWTVTLVNDPASVYTFHLTSDDGAALYLDGDLLIANDGLHGSQTRSANVSFPAGGSPQHTLAVRYFDAGGGANLQVEYALADRASGFVNRFFFPTSTRSTPETGYLGWVNDIVSGVEPGILFSQSTTSAVVNLQHYGQVNPGHFTGDFSAPDFFTSQSVLVTESRGEITIPTSGAWTFGVRSDDGFGCRIGTNYFSFPNGRAAADSFITLDLAAGVYPVQLVYFNLFNTGGELEFFAAPGTHTSYNSNFRLVGDVAGGGLPVAQPGLAGFPRAVVPGPVSVAFTKLPTAFRVTRNYTASGISAELFSFDVPSLGQVAFQPYALGANFNPPSATVAIGSTAQFQAGGGIAGRVTDAEGVPLLGVPVRAYFYGQNTEFWLNNFANAQSLPPGSRLYGNALIEDGVLKLTRAVGGQAGALVINQFNSGPPVASLSATFRLYVGGGSAPGADGFSFSFGPDVPDAYAGGEDGSGSGLRVNFDTWDNGGGEAPAIEVVYDNVLLGRVPIQVSQGPGGSAFRDVSIQLAGGQTTVRYDNVAVLANLPTPFLAGNGRIALAARTGGAYDNHWVDDLNLTVGLYSQSSQLRQATTDASGNYNFGADFILATPVLVQPDTPGFSYHPLFAIAYTGSNGLNFAALQSPPRFGQINAQSEFTVAEDSQLTVPFTVGDFQTPSENIAVTVASGNTSILPASGLVLSGSGSNRTLTITPAFNAFGDVQVTLTAYDRLAGPFNVRTVRSTGSVTTVAEAEAVLTNPDLQRSVFNGTSDTVNFRNAAFSGRFNDVAFPGLDLATPEDDFVVEITGTLSLAAPGVWTFGVRSDDGFECRVGTNTFAFTLPRAPADSYASFNLPAGTHPVRLIYFEHGGGAGLELFATPGSYDYYDDSFTLLGSGALARVPLLVHVTPVNDPPTAGAYTGMRFQNNRLRAPGAGGPMLNGELTIEFWQKVAAPQPHEATGVYPGQGEKLIRAYVPWADGNIYFDYGDWRGPGRLSYTPPPDANLIGTWQHWAFVASKSAYGGAGAMRIYRNGVLEAERNEADGFTAAAADLFLGGVSYQGDLADYRVWNVARTERQIQLTKDSPLRGDEANLLVYYRFIEGSGLTVNDSATLLGGTNSATLIDNPPPVWLANGEGNVHVLPADEDVETTLYLPAFDFDNTVLNYAITTPPAHGTLRQTNGYDGARWVYLPATNYFGTDTFVYSVTDGGGLSTNARIFLDVKNVNDVPVISTITSQTITESQVSQPIGFTLSDGDGFPELLEITAQSSDPILVRPENIRFQTNSPASRSLTILPEPEQIGTLTLTLIVSDGIDQASISFNVRIEPRPAYSIVDLGTVATRPVTFGTALNDRGAVAAHGTVNNQGQQPRAFVNQGIDNGLYVTDLGTLGGPTASAFGINADNDVVGESPVSAGGATNAFKTDGVTMQNLGTLTGGTYSRATAINDAGLVVGYATITGVKNRAFLWTPGGPLQNLGTLNGPFNDSSQAFAINTAGDVVGASFAANGLSRAFVRGAFSQTMIDLGTLPGGDRSVARGLNRFGHVVGSSTIAGGGTRAFLWRDGAMTSLGTLPGGGDSEARAINEFGQVAGFAFNSNGQRRATLFTQGQFFDLNDVVPEEQQLAGWTLTEANAINNRGEIAGTGVKGGTTRAFLIVPAAVIGRQVARPQGTVARRPEIELLDSKPGDSAENSFYWSDAPGEKKLYATRPVTARIKWGVTDSLLDTNRVAVVGINVWPRFPQIHVSESPVEIEPAVSGFRHKYLETRHTTSSDAAVDANTKVFTATNSGYTVLMYLRNNGASPDPLTQPPYFEVARTLPVYDVRHFLDSQPATIGPALTSPFHRDYPGRSGWVFFPHCFIDAAGEEAAYDRSTRTGPILPVNKLTPARAAAGYADPLVVVWYATNRIGVSWGQKAVRYTPDWDANAPRIVIASGQGAGFLSPSLFQDVRLYHQPLTNLPGFNPNEEHALVLPGPSGETVYALRNDLNGSTNSFSDPYALLKFRDPQANFEWRILPHLVVITNETYRFLYTGDVGKEIQPPFPLSVFNLCAASEIVSGPGWRDKNNKLYARAAGANLNDPVTIVTRYQYPMQPGFYYDLNRDGANDVPIGQCIPWLDRRPGGTPGRSIDVTYSIRWPTNAPTLQIGETLLRARRGLPDLANFASAEIIFDSTNPEGTNYAGAGTRLFDPLSARTLKIPLTTGVIATPATFTLPAALKHTSRAGREYFDDLPPDLINRLTFDPINKWLSFAGTLDESVAGQPLLLLNVMTPRERDRVLALDGGGTNVLSDWDKIVVALYNLTRNPNRVDLEPRDGQPDQALRLGLAPQYTLFRNSITNFAFTLPASYYILQGNVLVPVGNPPPFNAASSVVVVATNIVPEPLSGGKALIAAGYQNFAGPRFITIAENNSAELNAPVALHVIRVEGGPSFGDLKFLTPDNVFSEKLSIRHSADFGGEPERLTFEWYYKPDSAAFDATDLPRVDASGNVTDPRGWLFYSAVTPPGGAGVNSLTLGDGGESSLLVLGDNWFIGRYRGYNVGGQTPWSAWIGDPSGTLAAPRAALAEGWVKRVVRGLNPFDARTADFHSSAVNTFASMLQQVGARYEGDIAFNADPASINNVGLIQAYTTVLNRGKKLSIEGIPAVNFDPANNALLLAASRVSDFYMLLGNDAYADASDPTIGFGTASGEYGTAASSIFAFQNQLDSLLSEELSLLRGRDDRGAGVAAAPVYNRLFWNFTLGEGEVAYRQAYNVNDVNRDGFLDERDARLLYPQGHGDAWGHYLTALTTYYELLRHPNFTWVPRAENVLVAGVAVAVDFLDERKFAQAAAAKARAGAEIVNLTYREKYVDDTTGQWQGYKDTDTSRAWGVTEWARRAGQAAMFDWVTANAILFSTDPNPSHTGIQKIDRQTVLELREIPAQLGEIQKQLDQADIGLNPIGLAKGAVPFDIDPTFLEVGSTAQIGRRAVQGLTQFDQILERAISAMNNAVKVWNQANKATELLRRTQDTVEQFTQNTIDQERDYKNRLIEIFGYPYAGDIGAGRTYPSGYDGPDIYHYMYVPRTEITGQNAPPTPSFTAYFKPTSSGSGFSFYPTQYDYDPLTTDTAILQIDFPQTAADFGFEAPASWGQRRAPGELQVALGDLVQSETQLKQALQNYDGLVQDIKSAVELLEARGATNQAVIRLRTDGARQITSINREILGMQGTVMALRGTADALNTVTEVFTESLPKVVGFAWDALSGARAAAYGITAGATGVLLETAAGLEIASLSRELAKEGVTLQTEIKIERTQQGYEIFQQQRELEHLIRDEITLRLEVYNQAEVVRQNMGRFQSVLASGERLLQELTVFRQRAAAQTSASRYEDMTFRIFRNDALQKYRAAFDVAARYVYLAANAYDYEVNFSPGEPRAGREFLTDIIRQRSLGEMVDGDPAVGQPGLADPLARLEANWAVLKTQFGVINPQITDTRFSLREEMFRIQGDDDSTPLWREALMKSRVANLWDMPEFRRYCRPFAPETAGAQPGIVIRFPTTITFGLNYFGWPLAGGDNNYDPSQFSTKISRAGIWFSGSDGMQVSQTPRVYLVPVGMDVMRSPSGNTLATREWRIVDQAVPPPFPIGPSSLTDPNWIPQFDSLGGTFADIRRYGSMIAKHDSGIYAEDDLTNDTRLIGRSAWNTDWMLIIPGGTLLNDPNAGIDTFINTVNDIKIYFQTYSYSGN